MKIFKGNKECKAQSLAPLRCQSFPLNAYPGISLLIIPFPSPCLLTSLGRVSQSPVLLKDRPLLEGAVPIWCGTKPEWGYGKDEAFERLWVDGLFFSEYLGFPLNHFLPPMLRGCKGPIAKSPGVSGSGCCCSESEQERERCSSPGHEYFGVPLQRALFTFEC